LAELIGGACLCGEVAFEFDGPVLELELDHCSRCGKATGSAFASELQVASESFRWLRGRASTRVPTRHIFVGVKAGWFEIHDDLPRFQRKP
jgi:hypothetical protein